MWPFLSKLVSPKDSAPRSADVGRAERGHCRRQPRRGVAERSAGASALNPEGYEPMMRFFGISSALGFVLPSCCG
jgi:hypothetical protein